MWSERRLLEQLRTLVGQRLSPLESEELLADMRSVILREASMMRARRWRWRIAGGTGLAACLFAGVVYAKHWSDTAAARDFQAATVAAEHYDGWIKMVSVRHESAGQATVSTHANAAKGIFGEVRQSGETTTIVFRSTADGTFETYNSTDGVIHRKSLKRDDDDDAHERDILTPVSIGKAADLATSIAGHAPRVRTGGTDHGERQLDVTFFKSQEEEHEFRKHSPGNMPAAFSVWLNNNRDITRVAFKNSTGAETSRVTYGGNGIKSIYDLGVPRDARIVEETRREESRHDDDREDRKKRGEREDDHEEKRKPRENDTAWRKSDTDRRERD